MTHAMQMLFSLEARELVGNRWSKEEIQIFYKSLKTHGADFKKILNDLIEEDFTNRTFDNVRAMFTLVSKLLGVSPATDDNIDFVTNKMSEFFKFRNKPVLFQEFRDREEVMECSEQLNLKKKVQLSTPPRQEYRKDQYHQLQFSRSAENTQKSRSRTGEYDDPQAQQQQPFQLRDNYEEVDQSDQNNFLSRRLFSDQKQKISKGLEQPRVTYPKYSVPGGTKGGAFAECLPRQLQYDSQSYESAGGVRHTRPGFHQNVYGNNFTRVQLGYQGQLTTFQKRELKAAQNVSRRGVGPILGQAKDMTDLIIDERQEATQITPLQKQFQQCSKLSQRAFLAEHFYSYIDKPYFAENEFEQQLDKIGLSMSSKLNKFEWSFIRQKVGRKPRLFSAAFIEEERNKLHTYREITREILRLYTQQGVHVDQKGEVTKLELPSQFENSNQVKNVVQTLRANYIIPFCVAQQVVALHPLIKELRTGSLLTTYNNTYHVQFHNQELGVHSLSDTKIVPISASEFYYSDHPQTPQQSNAISVNQKSQLMISEQLDTNVAEIDRLLQSDVCMSFQHTNFTEDNFQAMALLLMMAERKDIVIKRLQQLDEQSSEQQQALLSELNACNRALKPLQHMMRIREIKPEFANLYTKSNPASPPHSNTQIPFGEVPKESIDEEFKTVYLGEGAYKRQRKSSGDTLADLVWLLRDWKSCLVQKDYDLESVTEVVGAFNLTQATLLINDLKQQGGSCNLESLEEAIQNYYKLLIN